MHICKKWWRNNTQASLTAGSGTKRATPLSHECRLGRKRICKITGDRKLCAKMASMGMVPGEEIDLLCADRNAQCILRAAGSTISLDARISDHVLVESV